VLAKAASSRWVLADFAANLSDPREREALAELAGEENRTVSHLPRSLRPVVVLHGMASESRSGMAAILRAVRLGLLGR
jgi:phytoene synthase